MTTKKKLHQFAVPGPHGLQATEINPLKSTLFVPENKTSLWVYQNDATTFDHELAGVWSQANYKLDKSSRQTGPLELWCFFDDDPLGIEESVLRNNPMQGMWGYIQTVQLRTMKKLTRPVQPPKPKEIIIVPPGDRIPPGLQVAGVWVKPIMKRDMSALADGTSGFLQVSGQIKKAEKHSIGGAWKMLGHNDEVARGRKKKNDPVGDAQGQWTITVTHTNGTTFPVSIMPGKKIAECLEKVCKEQGIPLEDNPTLSFEGTPLNPQKTILGSGIRNGDTIQLLTTPVATPMEIFVRNPKGKKFKFHVQPEELVLDVKKMVAQRMGIPVEKQRLFFHHVPLTKEKAPISEYKIKHKSVLDLAEMIIFVEPLTGPTIELDVEPNETIQQVKIKVKDIGGLPVEQQRLYFKGKQLTDDKATLNECNVQHLDTLTMKQPSEPPPKRQKPISRTKSLQSTTSNDEMIIHIVQDWDKDKFSIHVTPDLKIKELKRQIYKLRNIPVKEQILTFKKKPVLNVNTLQESNIKHKSILHLEAKDSPTRMADDHPMTMHETMPSTSISPTLEEVPIVTDVPLRTKPLPKKSLEGKVPLNDLPTPEPQHQLKNTKPGNIFIQPATGKRFPLRVDPKTYHLPDLKDQVAKRINRPPRKFQIVNEINGEPLSDKTIPTSGTTFLIKDMPDPEPITVKLLNGRTFLLMIDPDESIQDLKLKAAKRTGYPFDKLRILDDIGNEPTDDVKPTPRTTYHVAPPQIQLECLGSEPITIDILPKDTIGDIKDKVSSIMGIPPSKARNFFVDGEKPLDVTDDTPVLQTILQHGTTLQYQDVPGISTSLPRFPTGRHFDVAVEPLETKDDTKSSGHHNGLPIRSFPSCDDDEEILSDQEPERLPFMYDSDSQAQETGRPKQELSVDEVMEDVDDSLVTEKRKNNSRNFVYGVDNPSIDPNHARRNKAALSHGSSTPDNEPSDIDSSPKPRNCRGFNLVIDPDEETKEVVNANADLNLFPVRQSSLEDDEGEDRTKARHYYQIDTSDKKVSLEPTAIRRFEDIAEDRDEPVGSSRRKERLFFMDSEDSEEIPAELVKMGLYSRPMRKRSEIPELTMNTPTGRSMTVSGGPNFATDTSSERSKVRLVLHPVQSKLPDLMPLLIKSPGGRVYNIFVDPEEKVSTIKEKVKMQGLSVPLLKLYDLEGMEMDDDQLISSYQVRPGELLTLDPPQTGTDRQTSKKVQLSVLPTTAIIDITDDNIDDTTKDPSSCERVFFVDDEESIRSAHDPNAMAIQRKQENETDPLDEETPGISFRTNDGRCFHLSIDPDDTVKTVKAKLHAKVGLQVGGFLLDDLDFDEEDDDMLFLDLKPGARKGAVLVLEQPPQGIDHPSVKKSINSHILPTVSFGDHEDVVEESVLESKSTQQRIVFMDNDERSNRKSSSKKIELDKAVPIDKGVPIDEVPSDISFRTNDGRCFHLSIDPDDTVKTVKAKLHAKVGLQVGGFLLDDLDFDEEDDDMLFLDLKPGARKGAVLVLEQPPQGIDHPSAKKSIKSHILPTVSFGDHKDVVEESVLESKSTQQRIFFMDNDKRSNRKSSSKKIELDKGVSIEAYHFLLTVEHWNGRRAVITVDATEFIVDVKGKIFDAMKVPVEQQNLTCNGAPVREDLNLKEQNINKTSTLKLEPMMIHVTDPFGKKHTLTVEITDQILSIKDQLSHMTKIPAEIQCLVSGKDEFTNQMSLEDCKVASGDELHLEVFRVNIADWTGEQWSITGLKPSDQISLLKTRVYEKKDVPISMQKLMAEGKYLVDHGTLSSLGVKHRMMIMLEDPTSFDVQNPDRDTLSLQIRKPKKFETRDYEIWPVVPDWSKRIFFFDHETTLDDDLVELTVMLWTGENVILDKVNLGQTVCDLKNCIQQRSGNRIHMDKYKVTFHGKKLDQGRTLRQQMITHKSVLVVEGKHNQKIVLPDTDRISVSILPTKIKGNMRINVRHWRGDEFSIDVEPTYYLDDIKEKIQMLCNVPIEQQRLVYDGNTLSDTEIISKQGMVSGCTIFLEQMILRISLPRSDELLLKVEPSDTIGDLKTLIFEATEIPVETQCIMFGGEELLDVKTLEESEIGHEDLLQVEEFKLLIVDSLGESFRLSGLTPSSTIEEVKEKIFRVKHIQKKQQKLFFHGKPLEGKKSLREEEVVHKSVFILEVVSDDNTVDEPRAKVSFMTSLSNSNRLKTPFMINVKHWNGVDRFTIESDPAEYADDVREKIQRKHQIPFERQILTFHGVLLRDDLNLEKQQILNGSTLTLESMKIFLEMPDGTRTSHKVEPTYTIRHVKESLFASGSDRVGNQCLMLGGQELHDDMSLEHYQIKHEEILVVDMFMVMVIDASGSAIEITNLTPQSTLAEVKQGIRAARSIPLEKQRLSYQGVLLNENKTLADEGIHHKSVIILEELNAELTFPKIDKIRLGTFPATGAVIPTGILPKLNHFAEQNDDSGSLTIKNEHSLMHAHKAVNNSHQFGDSTTSRTSTNLEPIAGERSKWWENVPKKVVPTPQASNKSKKIKFERKKKEQNDETLPMPTTPNEKPYDDDQFIKKAKKTAARRKD